MHKTGIIRKIDDLGRIVLPKELRKTFNIKSGDDLEIIVDGDKISLEKFSLLEGYNDNITKIINCFTSELNYKIYVSINDEIINTDKKVTTVISNIINTRKLYYNNLIEDNIICDDICINGKLVIMPIVINSDLLGGIIIVSNDNINSIITCSKIILNLIKKLLDTK